MIDTRRLRRLVVSVAALSACLVFLSRRAGRVDQGPPGEPGAPAAQADATPAPGDRGSSAADVAGDLSFFKALGKPKNDGDVAPPMMRGSPERPQPQAASGAFVVQAMATPDGAAARRMRDRLARGGIPATILEDRQGARVSYRVRTGRYRERSSAEALARRLRDDFGLSPWILSEGE